MAINKIIKYQLESRAAELRDDNQSHAEMSETLSKESKHKITASTVQRYFKTIDKDKVELVEKNDQLKAKVVEAEINTINECMGCIAELKDICEIAKKEGNTKDAIQAINKIYTGLDMLNKVLGKYQTAPAVQVNFNEVNIDDKREQLIGGIVRDPSRGGAAETIEQTDG